MPDSDRDYHSKTTARQGGRQAAQRSKPQRRQPALKALEQDGRVVKVEMPPNPGKRSEAYRLSDEMSIENSELSPKRDN